MRASSRLRSTPPQQGSGLAGRRPYLAWQPTQLPVLQGVDQERPGIRPRVARRLRGSASQPVRQRPPRPVRIVEVDDVDFEPAFPDSYLDHIGGVGTAGIETSLVEATPVG